MKSHKNVPKKISYRLSYETGLILSLSICILLFKADINSKTNSSKYLQGVTEEIYIEEIVQTKQELKVPAPPKPSVPIEVPNSEIIEDEILEINAELEIGASLEIPIPPKPHKVEDEIEEEVFIVVEQPPFLIGGIESIQKLIHYPKMALEAGIEGRVIIQFVINSDGTISSPFVVRGIGGGCDEEALKAVGKAKFRPGMQRGRPVRVQYTLPITFKLKQNKSN